MAVVIWTDESGETKDFRIDADEFSIGRDSSNDLCLTAGSVSRDHAMIRRDGDRYFLIDNSTNGTIVDNVLLKKGDRQEIKSGSTIVIGDTRLNFAISQEEEDALRTRIMPAKAPPRLVLLEKGKPGKEFPFETDEIHIGSEESNDIVLKGSYVSRKHARVVREGAVFILRDLSVNGTLVNSQRVKERELKDGDIISIMDHQLSFVTAGSSVRAPRAGAEEEKKRKIRIALLASSIVLLVLVISLGVSSTSKKKGASPPGAEVTAPVRTGMESVLKEADDLVAQERWQEALAKLEAIGTTDSSYLAAQKKISSIRGELRCQEMKPEIEQLIEAQNFAQAKTILEGLPSESKCAESVRTEFESRLSDFCQENLRLAREALEQEGAATAKPLIDKCLAAMPQNAEAVRLAQVVEEELGKTGGTEATSTSSAPPPSVSREEEKNQEIARKKYDEALRTYLAGNVAGAISGMREINALSLPANDPIKRKAAKALENLTEAKARYENGASQYAAGSTSKAYYEWNAFLTANRQLDRDRKGKLFKDVADKMTATYCKFASEKYKKDDYAEAFKWWWKAKEVDPNDPEARQGLEALERYAVKKYREGYMLAGQGSIESAATCFKEVTRILPSDHEYYLKAQKKLVEIGR